jgi:hypothetical protein
LTRLDLALPGFAFFVSRQGNEGEYCQDFLVAHTPANAGMSRLCRYPSTEGERPAGTGRDGQHVSHRSRPGQRSG